jgi:hypothetical protein
MKITKLDVAQNWIVELIGTAIFLLSACNIILPMIGQSAYVDFTLSLIGIMLGLVLMGKRVIAEKLGNIFRK